MLPQRKPAFSYTSAIEKSGGGFGPTSPTLPIEPRGPAVPPDGDLGNDQPNPTERGPGGIGGTGPTSGGTGTKPGTGTEPTGTPSTPTGVVGVPTIDQAARTRDEQDARLRRRGRRTFLTAGRRGWGIPEAVIAAMTGFGGNPLRRHPGRTFPGPTSGPRGPEEGGGTGNPTGRPSGPGPFRKRF